MKLRITYYVPQMGQIHETVVVMDDEWHVVGERGASMLGSVPMPGSYVPPEDWILCVEPA